MTDSTTTIQIVLTSFIGPISVGIVLWFLGKHEIKKRNQTSAIRDLMTFRGDYASQEFRRALNKVSITFHKDDEIREDVRNLYEAVNNPSLLEDSVNRKIVGLIYKLCQKNGFKGLTEYDIDQAFPESKQSPESSTPSIIQPNNSLPTNCDSEISEDE